jgi:hypothetical protein
MICPTCIYYAPLSQRNPISPACTWRPSPEQIEALLAILPAPHASRVHIMHSPYQVEACAAFASVDGGGHV